MNNEYHDKSIGANQSDYIWHDEVRGYEVDLQGIVNNANYLHYFDHTRVKHLMAKGIDWHEWHLRGYNLVLVHVDMRLKSSLKVHECFYITSNIERSGKIRTIFRQSIYRRKDDSLVAHASNTTVCIDTKTNKPVMPNDLESLLFPENH